MNHDLEMLRVELERALTGLDSLQTQCRPPATQQRLPAAQEKWSIQQIVGHLLLTYAATTNALEARLLRGQPTKAKVTLVQRGTQFTLLRAGYFPRGRVAPEAVRPAVQDVLSASVLMAQIGIALAAMDEQLEVCAARFGNKKRSVNHMVLGPLSVDQWARFHLVHGRHHIRQITAIRRGHGV